MSLCICVILLFFSAAGESVPDVDLLGFPILSLGLKEVLETSTVCKRIVSSRVNKASSIVRATAATDVFKNEISTDVVVSDSLCRQTVPLDESLSRIISNHGSKILLNDSDRKPRNSKKKGKKHSKPSLNRKTKGADCADDWQGLPPWKSLDAGDGCPKFLCDVMVS